LCRFAYSYIDDTSPFFLMLGAWNLELPWGEGRSPPPPSSSPFMVSGRKAGAAPSAAWLGSRGAILKGETTILCAGEPRSRGTLARRALGWIRVGSARGERARQAVRNVPAPGHGAGTRACGPAWRLGQPDNHLSFGRFLSLLLSFLRVFCKVSFLVFSSKVGATSIVNNTLNLPIHSAK
jgi:hypothetical protein